MPARYSWLHPEWTRIWISFQIIYLTHRFEWAIECHPYMQPNSTHTQVNLNDNNSCVINLDENLFTANLRNLMFIPEE